MEATALGQVRGGGAREQGAALWHVSGGGLVEGLGLPRGAGQKVESILAPGC